MTLADQLRPTDFDQVIGQDDVVKCLKNILESGLIPVTMMFSGPSGTGKTTLANIFATKINGEVHEVNAATANGVDDARRLAENSVYRPFNGDYQVVILDEAHMMTPQAQNALLKPLETPGHTVFIFCTTDPQKLIQTVKSRATKFNLQHFGRKQIRTLLDKLDQIYLEKQNHAYGTPEFLEMLVSADVLAPRDIINAYELRAAGMSLHNCVSKPEPDNNHAKISYAIIDRGAWDEAKVLLNPIRPGELQQFRPVISGIARNALLREPVGKKADLLASLLKNLALYETYADGVSLGALTASLYEYSRKLNA